MTHICAIHTKAQTVKQSQPWRSTHDQRASHAATWCQRDALLTEKMEERLTIVTDATQLTLAVGPHP